MNEVRSVEVTFHIFPTKCLSPTLISLSLLSTSLRPYSPSRRQIEHAVFTEDLKRGASAIRA